MQNKIKEILKQKGLKQRWLAKQLGKSTNAVCSFVNNKSQPSLNTLQKIADILNVNIKKLL